MKTRSGLVSNSSTSSFICVICGGTEADMDLSMSDCYMCSCAGCGNEMHEHCAKVPEELKEEFSEALSDDRYDVDAKYCPVCKLEMLTVEDEMTFYRMEHGYKNADTLKAITEKYKSYKNFTDATKKWKEANK